MLAIDVELLHGTVRAASIDDLALTGADDPGDWPPSPARLFAALVAADGTRGRCRVTTGSELVGLEAAPPPRIIASPPAEVCITRLRERYIVSPGTSEGTVQNYPGRIAAVVRPGTRLAPRSARVTYIWDDLTPSSAELAGLRARAARVGYLGCSDSPVRVRVFDELPVGLGIDEAWCPDPNGQATMAVPFSGMTEVLDAMYDDFAAGMPVRRAWYRTEVAGYRPPGPVAAPVVEPWPYTFWLQLEEPLPARRGLDLTVALKAATLSLYAAAYSGSDADMPAILHGHRDAGERGYQLVQWVALPNVGHPHSDGRLHGAAVMIPEGTEPELIHRIGAVLAGLSTLMLRGGRPVAIHVGQPDRDAANTVRARRWQRPSRTWASASPVVFERRTHDDDILDEAARWCRHAGFPEPIWAMASLFPLLPGAPSLAPSEVFREGHGERRPYRHIRLRFADRVAGPMVLGRARQMGLGLMAPIDAREDG